MRPAFSVLFLTTLIGAGQGLLVALVAGQWYFVIGAGPAAESGRFYALGVVAALAFLGLGLFASFFHLAKPQRAWRTISQWRTSWLSREVILLPAVVGLAMIYGGVHFLEWKPVLLTFTNQKSLDLSMALGFLVAGAALLLFVATGMIYACVRFMPQWSSAWTVVNYTLMGLSSGFIAATAFATWAKSPLAGFFAAAALVLTLTALVGKAVHLWRNGRIKPTSSMRTAIGVNHRNIRQMTQGFMGHSFNTREFFHPGSPEAVKGVVALGLAFGFAIPAGLVVAAWVVGEWQIALAAVAIQYAGLLAERWAFFAQGHHVQNLYYQTRG